MLFPFVVCKSAAKLRLFFEITKFFCKKMQFLVQFFFAYFRFHFRFLCWLASIYWGSGGESENESANKVFERIAADFPARCYVNCMKNIYRLEVVNPKYCDDARECWLRCRSC